MTEELVFRNGAWYPAKDDKKVVAKKADKKEEKKE
jgi:hypothetical protein